MSNGIVLVLAIGLVAALFALVFVLRRSPAKTPVADHAAEAAPPGMLKRATSKPVAVSQIRVVLSQPALRIRRPSGLKAADLTQPS